MQSDAQEEKGKSGITKLVKQEGGKCRLYKTSGAAFDFISVVTGITTAAAIKIAEEIEQARGRESDTGAGHRDFLR